MNFIRAGKTYFLKLNVYNRAEKVFLVELNPYQIMRSQLYLRKLQQNVIFDFGELKDDCLICSYLKSIST